MFVLHLQFILQFLFSSSQSKMEKSKIQWQKKEKVDTNRNGTVQRETILYKFLVWEKSLSEISTREAVKVFHLFETVGRSRVHLIYTVFQWFSRFTFTLDADCGSVGVHYFD